MDGTRLASGERRLVSYTFLEPWSVGIGGRDERVPRWTRPKCAWPAAARRLVPGETAVAEHASRLVNEAPHVGVDVQLAGDELVSYFHDVLGVDR